MPQVALQGMAGGLTPAQPRTARQVDRTRPAYPPEFRRVAVQMLRAGRTPRELAERLGVSQQTLCNWRRQDQLDRHERDDA